MNIRHRFFLNKGFTLIELLVVIAIIGILSSIVTVNLLLARQRSVDTGIRANLSSVRAQAALYRETNGTYGVSSACGAVGTVFSDPVIIAQIAQAVSASGGSATCRSSANQFAVSVPLVAEAPNHLCIDANAVLKVIPNAVSSTQCP